MQFHRVLQRQIKKYLSVNAKIPPDFDKLLAAISDAYTHFDEDRALIERSLEISSKEMTQINNHLRQSTYVLKKAQQIAHIGSWEWNFPDNSFTLSDEIYEILNHKVETGENTFELLMNYIHPDDRKRVADLFQKALVDKNPFEYIARIVRNDKTERVIHVRGEIVETHKGQATRIIGTTHDITERSKQEEEIKKRTQELEKLNSLMIGREVKMAGLKKEIEAIRKNSG